MKSIGRYQVERELARGGMGAVYVCLDPTRDRRVAVKVITLPLENTFWGARFGMFTDRFGVQWMFNCSAGTSS